MIFHLCKIDLMDRQNIVPTGQKIHLILNLCKLGNFACSFVFCLLICFKLIRVSNSWDLDQALHFVGPDLDPNCLKMLSADVKCHQ